MPGNRLKIEIFSAPGCNKCVKALKLVQGVVATISDEIMTSELIDIRQVNIIEELDYAVTMGIRATPGIVINGQLVFTTEPSEKALRETILTQISKLEKP